MTQYPHHDEDRHYTTQPTKNQDPDTDDYGEPLPFFLTRRGMITMSVAIAAIGGAALAENLPTWIHNAQATGSAPTPSATPASRNTAAASTSPVPKATISDKPEAIEGKYVHAHAYAPARNVPAPTREPGSNAPDLSGLKKTIKYWCDYRNYAVQTGQYEPMKYLVAPSEKTEWEHYKYNKKLYQDGGWIVDGIMRYEFSGEPYLGTIWEGNNATEGEYVWYYKRFWEHKAYVLPDGNVYVMDAPEKARNGSQWRLLAKHDGAQWMITRIDELDKEKSEG